MAEQFFNAPAPSQDEFDEVQEQVELLVIGNYTKYTMISQNVGKNSSYTAPVDGIYVISVAGENGYAGVLYSNDGRSRPIMQSQNSGLIAMPIFLKANQKIYTRSSYGSYVVEGYYSK